MSEIEARVVPHPAARLPMSLRVHYAAVIVTLVYTDGKAHAREVRLVERLCDALGLDDYSRQTVREMMERATPRHMQTDLTLLGGIGDLRFSLMADAIAFCFVDGRLASGEATALSRFAELLGITREQALVLSRWVETRLGEGGRARHPLTAALGRGLPPSVTEDPEATVAAVRWLESMLRGPRGEGGAEA